MFYVFEVSNAISNAKVINHAHFRNNAYPGTSSREDFHGLSNDKRMKYFGFIDVFSNVLHKAMKVIPNQCTADHPVCSKAF